MGCIHSKNLYSSSTKQEKEKVISEAGDFDLFSDYFSVKKTKEQLNSPNIIAKRISCQDTSVLKTETGLNHIKSSMFEGTNENSNIDNNSNNATTPLSLNFIPSDKSNIDKINHSSSSMQKSIIHQDVKGIVLELKFIDSQQQASDSNIDIITIHQHLLLKENGEVNKTANSNNEISFIFGKSNSSNKQGSNGASLKNDYGISDSYIEERQFEIVYDVQFTKYYIGDLNEGNGIFKKILDKQIVNGDIDGGMIVTFCNCYLCFEYQEPKTAKQIKVTFLDKVNRNRVYIFSPLKEKCITFGRSKTANVIINQSEVSRIQCSLIYENDRWVLYNGYIDIDNVHQLSTNGIFFQIKTKIEIENGQIFKTGKTLIYPKLIDKSNI